MSHRIPSRSQCAMFVLIAAAAGCSSQQPAGPRIVTGTVDSKLLSGVGQPSVVAQALNGTTYDAPVDPQSGGFTLDLPPDATYRLFLTNTIGGPAAGAGGGTSSGAGAGGTGAGAGGTGATGNTADGTGGATGGGVAGTPGGAGGAGSIGGMRSAVTRILWPGGNAWANIPPGGGTGPIDLGNINLISGVVGAGTLDGPGGVLGGPSGGGTGGTTTGGTGAGGTSGTGTGGAGGTGGTSTGGGSTDGTGGTGGTGTGGTGTGGTGGTGTGTGGTGTGGTGTGTGTGTGGVGSGTTDGNGAGNGTGAVGGGFNGGGTAVGVNICNPQHQSVGQANGTAGANALVGGFISETQPPSCVSGGTSTNDSPTGGSGTGSGGGAQPNPVPSTAPPGIQCEEGNIPMQRKDGRWDCVKMETPVTYFYSDKPIKVRASVEFPNGVLTQWYPQVVDSYPNIADRLEAPQNMNAKACMTIMGNVAAQNGLLDWGTFDVLGRNANVDARLPDANLDRYTWAFARQVAANPVSMGNGQLEKFLFYRGIGNFSLPVRVQATGNSQLVLSNQLSDPIGSVFYLNVTPERGVYTKAAAGIAAGKAINGAIPSLAQGTDVESYAEALAKDVRQALDANGLFDDEATAMVNTWKRQWFRTPGARLLYIAPQSWTDQSIPLNIDPKPESLKRVMVIRVEIVTPELEASDTAALKQLQNPASAPAAKAHFASLGRFAEPRLRRAISRAGNPSYAMPLLNETIETNHTTHTPTAGTKALVPNAGGPKYAGKGFVVHEWGTDTIVVGSDGSQLLGLQHEEEDLPKFVYDRRKH